MLLQALCIISYPLVNSIWSYSPETPNLGQIWRFLEPCDLEIWRMTLKNNRAPLLCHFKLCAAYRMAMNVLAIFQNDPWKFTDVRALTVIFHVQSLQVGKCEKKSPKFFFGDYEKKTELILINMCSPTFVPNLVTLAWKMSSGMPKEAGSLNGPLCAYLMRQNLHDRTRPRS